MRALTTDNGDSHLNMPMGLPMMRTRLADAHGLLSLLVAAILCGCSSQNGDSSGASAGSGSSGFEQNLSGRFSASLTSDKGVTLRYEAPDGIGLKNVDIRVVPVWQLQSVVDGMRSPTSGMEVHWDSLAPGESREIDLGEPPQVNDGVTSVSIEGTAELQGSHVRFALNSSR